MGECIISRASIAGEAESPIPITPGYHSIRATVRDVDGALLSDYEVNCTDGSTNYNYRTNARGQVLFVCNSGAANIFVNNYVDGYQILDMQSCWTNIDAPVGQTSDVEINLPPITNNSYHQFNSNKLFRLWKERDCDICIIGGGGGGGSCWANDDGGWDYIAGEGGGAGYMNNYYNQKLNGNYNFISGLKGSGGFGDGTERNCNDGNSGGTSYIVNTGYSAIGGAGGKVFKSTAKNTSIGGLGNGGMRNNTKAGNSPVDFAGGGGAYGHYNNSGGYPYGGNSAFITYESQLDRSATDGRFGGGGAGGNVYSSWQRHPSGTNGGAGLMRIYIRY